MVIIMVFTKEDHDLEYRVTHPDEILSANDYRLDDDTQIKVEYRVEDLEYKDDGLHGKLILVLYMWNDEEKEFDEIYYKSLEHMLLVEAKGMIYQGRVYESGREHELKDEYASLFSMDYNSIRKNQIGSKEHLTLPYVVFKDSLDGLFSNLNEQYSKYSNNFI